MDQTMQEKIPAINQDSTSEEMAHAIFDVLDAKKAYKLKVLRVNDQTVITDYFVIATGNSNTHVKSLGGEVEYKLSLCGIDPFHDEGRESDGWVVIDYGHVMVHIFSRDQRDFYQLEKLYGDAEEVIFVAHLYEGYVKLGANDNISGSAALIEVARTLNHLIETGQIERPARSIRFIWIPEFQGSIPWAQQNKDILSRTLCNINLDMVGLWLSKSQSFYCLHRTTMGNPHYLNDVAESFYHYMGATNKAYVATGVGRPEATKPVYSVTGSRDPFYYSINAHYGASDHEVFSDWGVQAPGVIMITWPDNYYHTSGDRPEICDPTQLHRAIVLAAASAYTIAEADAQDAVKIASEVAANAAKRMSIKMKQDLAALNSATAADFAALYKDAKWHQDAMLNNEIATLATVLELAPASASLKEFVAAMQEGVKANWAANGKNIDAAMKAKAAALGVAPVKAIVLSAEEKAASKVYPKSTAKVLETGYGVLRTVPRELIAKYGFDQRGAVNHSGEIAKLTTTGTNSILDIQKMLATQFPNPDSLETITKYVEMLKEAGLVEF